MRATGAGIVGGGLAETAAAGTDTQWRQFGADAGNTSYIPADVGPSQKPTTQWIAPQLRLLTSPATVDDGTIYVGEVNGVTALDASDGTRRWHFDESESAVDAFQTGEWEQLLLQNLADIQRTRELAVLAGSYVLQSDFRMKNLSPPQ